MDWVIRILGILYVAGSVLLVRQLALDAMAGQLEGLLYGQGGRDRIRYLWLRIGAALTLACGLAMALLSQSMLPLLFANCAAQGGWLVYAGQNFPPESDEELLGRRQTINAMIGLLVITMVVFWSVRGGTIRLPSDELLTWLPVAAGAGILAYMLIGHRRV